MQRLQLSPEERITRKEYLKRKKKQASKIFKTKSKITYFLFFAIIALIVYVFVQFSIYKKSNNYKYVEGDGVDSQQVYNVYYVTEGYTYDPVYSINSITSSGFNDSLYYLNSGLVNISVDNDYIYGLKEDGLYRVKKSTKEMEKIIEKDVSKYKVAKDRVYFITKSERKIGYVKLDTLKIEYTQITDISEILIDDNNLFAVKDVKKSKKIMKYDIDGNNEETLDDKDNISYIVQDESDIYFVNKNDGKKIYKISKQGGDSQKVCDIAAVCDNGVIDEIDGSKYMFVYNQNLYFVNVDDENTLWKIDTTTSNTAQVIPSSVEIMQSIDGTVFYKEKGQMGIYLYNLDTNFMAQVTSRKLKEFIVDEFEKVDINSIDKKSNIL